MSSNSGQSPVPSFTLHTMCAWAVLVIMRRLGLLPAVGTLGLHAVVGSRPCVFGYDKGVSVQVGVWVCWCAGVGVHLVSVTMREVLMGSSMPLIFWLRFLLDSSTPLSS